MTKYKSIWAAALLSGSLLFGSMAHAQQATNDAPGAATVGPQLTTPSIKYTVLYIRADGTYRSTEILGEEAKIALDYLWTRAIKNTMNNMVVAYQLGGYNAVVVGQFVRTPPTVAPAAK